MSKAGTQLMSEEAKQVSATNLPQMDLMGTADPFCKLRVCSAEYFSTSLRLRSNMQLQ
jgi:hypothetical protein